MPLLHTRSFAADRPGREPLSEWSCVGCTPQSNCYDGGDTWRSLRYKKKRDFTDSQAMGYALVLAEQYVREAQKEEEEECDGFSLVGWSHIATPTGSPFLSGHKESAHLETTEQRQAFLSLPMRSTRSRDAKMRTVSSGSTVCETAESPAASKGGKAKAMLLRRPATWIRGVFRF
ncbi:hypothetical protein GGI20_000467 [Coemansia sp. BCRC 34301]|nr:hypothetical protein GGI20_000467 [Coemansia sp. BCRC 34301]